MRGRVQNKDMTSPNRHLYARDERIPFAQDKVLIEGQLVMIGDEITSGFYRSF
jgi:hypothetical protein